LDIRKSLNIRYLWLKVLYIYIKNVMWLKIIELIFTMTDLKKNQNAKLP
jgi:hypothetical protein